MASYYTRTMRRVALGAAAVILVVIFGAALLVLRPGAAATSSVRPDVTIECTGAVGLEADACGAWGDELLAEDPAPRTFEREDLRRLRLDRDLFGFADACRVEYFLSRYPDSPVWTAELSCR